MSRRENLCLVLGLNLWEDGKDEYNDNQRKNHYEYINPNKRAVYSSW